MQLSGLEKFQGPALQVQVEVILNGGFHHSLLYSYLQIELLIKQQTTLNFLKRRA